MAQHLHQHVLGAAALGDGNRTALQVGELVHRSIPAHQYRAALARYGLGRDVEQVGAGCLREDGRCVSRRTEIHGTPVQRLKQRRTGRELVPTHHDALRPQRILKHMAALEKRQGAGFLVADAELPDAAGTGGAGERRGKEQRGQRAAG